jgi:hypothetical protein
MREFPQQQRQSDRAERTGLLGSIGIGVWLRGQRSYQACGWWSGGAWVPSPPPLNRTDLPLNGLSSWRHVGMDRTQLSQLVSEPFYFHHL